MTAKPDEKLKLDLRACPFCGSPAMHYADAVDNDYNWMFAIECSDCPAGVEGIAAVDEDGGAEKAIRRAVSAWNRREGENRVNTKDLTEEFERELKRLEQEYGHDVEVTLYEDASGVFEDMYGNSFAFNNLFEFLAERISARNPKP